MMNDRNCVLYVCVCTLMLSVLSLLCAAAPGQSLQLRVRCFSFHFTVIFHTGDAKRKDDRLFQSFSSSTCQIFSGSIYMSIKTQDMCRVLRVGWVRWNLGRSCCSDSQSRVQTQTSWRNKHPFMRFCSDLELFFNQQDEIPFTILGLKDGFIFTPVYQPDYSGDPWR